MDPNDEPIDGTVDPNVEPNSNDDHIVEPEND